MPRGLRYAVMAAAMALASLAGSTTPGTAAPETTSAKPLALGQFTKHRAHTRKKHVRPHRSAKKHRTSTESRTKAKTVSSKSDTTKNAKDESRLPSSVADARAEVPNDNPAQENPAPDTSTLTEADKTAVERPLAAPPAQGVEVTTSDQLNEIDRAVAEPEPQHAMTLALAQMPEPTESVSEGGIWGSASLVGKIFIAIGVLLTFASAARMLWPQRTT